MLKGQRLGTHQVELWKICFVHKLDLSFAPTTYFAFFVSQPDAGKKESVSAAKGNTTVATKQVSLSG